MGGEWLGSFMQATRDAEDSYYKAMKMRQMQEYAPMMKRIKEMEAERERYQMETQKAKRAMADIELQGMQNKQTQSKIGFAGRLIEESEKYADNPEIQRALLRGGSMMLGIDDMFSFDNIDPAMLEMIKTSANTLVRDKVSNLQKGKTIITRGADGKARFATNMINPTSGEANTVYSPIDGPIISELGETILERSAREVKTSRDKSMATGVGADKAERISTTISNGMLAADSTAVTRRALTLLDDVKTGGLASVAHQAKQFFGVAGADEAELSYHLGKNVLGQLKTVFGAQFTNEESKRLEKMEAGLGQSVAGNRRILEQALKMQERAARRGISMAERNNKDGVYDWEISEINNALKWDIEVRDQAELDAEKGIIQQKALDSFTTSSGINVTIEDDR